MQVFFNAAEGVHHLRLTILRPKLNLGRRLQTLLRVKKITIESYS